MRRPPGAHAANGSSKTGSRCGGNSSRYIRTICAPSSRSRNTRIPSMPERAAFLAEPREVAPRRAPAERVRDWNEIYLPFAEGHLRKQASRCMDCGVPLDRKKKKKKK